MNQKTYQFKTNINCSGCIAAVTPVIETVPGLLDWHVDTSIPEKILTVHLSESNPGVVIEKVIEAGYRIEPK